MNGSFRKDPALYVDSKSCESSKERAKELNDLRMALKIAKTEVAQLQSEKSALREELDQQESQIRLEVSEEMEERLRLSRQRNLEELNRLRSQLNFNQPTCQSTRKAQADKVDTQIEELLDRVDECEEEMVRMRHVHKQEIDSLKETLKAAQSKSVSFAEDSVSTKKVAELEKELAATRTQMERLEKSKIELIESYEKLLKEADCDEGESGSEHSDVEADPENHKYAWKKRLFHRKATGNAQARKPLGKISGNVAGVQQSAAPIEHSSSREKWIFPKKPSAKDEMGAYKRPSGRAPHGREWDPSVGAWRVSAT